MMTLNERVHLCVEPECKRAAIKDGNRCEAHRLKWVPAWVARMQRGEARGKVLA